MAIKINRKRRTHKNRIRQIKRWNQLEQLINKQKWRILETGKGIIWETEIINGMGTGKELEIGTDNGHEHLNRLTTLLPSIIITIRLVIKRTIERKERRINSRWINVEDVGECVE